MHPSDGHPVTSVTPRNSSSDWLYVFALVSDDGIFKIEVLKCYLLNYYLNLSQKGQRKCSISCQNVKKKEKTIHLYTHTNHHHNKWYLVYMGY